MKADEIRTLVKDIWDVRMAKLRSSIDVFLKSEATHAKVTIHTCQGNVCWEVIFVFFFTKIHRINMLC